MFDTIATGISKKFTNMRFPSQYHSKNSKKKTAV